MNKAQFIAYLAPQFGDSKKEAARAVEVVFDAIVRNISKGDDVMINDFGKFKKVDRPARKGRNPFTGESIQIKASKKVRFLPAKGLKEVISGARKLGAAPTPPAKAAPAKAVKKAGKAKKVARKPAKKAKKSKRR
ncbi:DNA-binding protein HU [Candidatus Planktophila sp.]|jgi:DNA-binding protein HU-beta|nr:DNA-binding protein HU [Candidatus Planktophila sp.]